MDLADIVLLFWCEIGFQRQVAHADNGVHGGADFMAHVGQEIALGLGGLLGNTLGLFDILHHVEHGPAGLGQFIYSALKSLIGLLSFQKRIFQLLGHAVESIRKFAHKINFLAEVSLGDLLCCPGQIFQICLETFKRL